MKKVVLLTISLLLLHLSYGQLSGIKTIPGDYATIAAAVTDLNTASVGAGGVTFNVAAGYTESITTTILLTATGTAAKPVVFQKSGSGANPVITRSDAGNLATSILGGQGDAVIMIKGSDYVTFNGIDVAATNEGIEYGYYLIKASPANGCKYVTITNCAVTMTKGTSQFVAGIYASNNDINCLVSSATGNPLSSTGGRHENVTLTGNTISNVFSGILLIGYNHTSSPYDFQDQNFVVGASGAGNTIQNFGGNVASTSYGVYLMYHTSPSVCYNTISNTAGSGSNATAAVYGVYMGASNAGGDFAASNNTITLGQGSTSEATPISSLPTCTTVTITNNTFGYGSFASTVQSRLVFITGNSNNITATGNQTAGTISKTGSGNFYGIYCTGSPTGGTANISNNNFSNISLTGFSMFSGIYQNTNITQQQTLNNNNISNITGGTSPVYGIFQGVTAGNSSVSGNTISNITNGGILYGMSLGNLGASVSLVVANNTIRGMASTGSSVVMGISSSSVTSASINGNNIYGLSGSNAGTTVRGILVASGVTTTIYNNFISDLRAPAASAALAIAGVYLSGGATHNVYNNSVYLSGTSSSALFGSAAIRSVTTSTLDLRNNTLVNLTTPIGTGKASAFQPSSATLTNYAATSNNNLLYAGTPSSSHVIFYDGTSSDQAMEAYQGRVSPREAASVTELPPFVNTTTTPYDLHLQTTITTLCESGGTVVSTPVAIATDIDNDPRYPNPGYPDNATTPATRPDIGADEFGGTRPGPLSGVFAIPGDFPSITSAATAINIRGIGTGGVTFNVAAGYTETTVWPILISATGNLSNPIIFQKSGNGANPVVTRTDAGIVATSVLGGQGDAVIIIQGSDYVTFNGIDVAASNQGIEYGYYLIKASPTDGCKNVTITNCAITMTKGTSGYVAGIYASNNDVSSWPSSIVGITPVSTGGRNENVTLTGNTISNVITGILLIGYNHTTAPYDLQDQNFVVGASGAGNTIQNFGGNSAIPSYGIFLFYHISPSICYNTINNTAGGGSDATATVFGVKIGYSNSGGDFVANNNTITLGQAS
ncbi:MAG: hypothetical protein WCK34_15280, partial [Bacteroidota bacterium]